VNPGRYSYLGKRISVSVVAVVLFGLVFSALVLALVLVPHRD
jgi:hypothetical protein